MHDAIFIAAILSITALSACGSVSSSKNALTVNKTNYTVAQFERLSKELIVTKQIESTAGQISGTDSKNVLSALIRFIATNQFLEANNDSITDLDRKSVTDGIKADDPYYSWSKELQRLSIDLGVADTAIARVKTPDAKTLEKMYSTAPASAGALCIRHIILKTEAEARSVLNQIKDGGDFIALAKKLSIEPSAKDTGGALQIKSSDCVPLIDLLNSSDPVFIRAVLAAKVGVPSGPVKSSAGYHVIMNRPYSEIADSLQATLATDSGSRLAIGFLLSINVKVNPKFGTWNPTLGKVE